MIKALRSDHCETYMFDMLTQLGLSSGPKRSGIALGYYYK